MVTLYSVFGVWTLLAGRGHIRGMVGIIAPSLLYCAYSLAVVTLDPVFSRYKAECPMPWGAECVLGWGLPCFLSGGALCLPGVWQSNRQVKLLLAWLVVFFGLIRLPLGYELKLILGVHVVMCILAAMAVAWALRLLRSIYRDAS